MVVRGCALDRVPAPLLPSMLGPCRRIALRMPPRWLPRFGTQRHPPTAINPAFWALGERSARIGWHLLPPGRAGCRGGRQRPAACRRRCADVRGDRHYKRGLLALFPSSQAARPSERHHVTLQRSSPTLQRRWLRHIRCWGMTRSQPAIYSAHRAGLSSMSVWNETTSLPQHRVPALITQNNLNAYEPPGREGVSRTPVDRHKPPGGPIAARKLGDAGSSAPIAPPARATSVNHRSVPISTARLSPALQTKRVPTTGVALPGLPRSKLTPAGCVAEIPI